MANPHGGNSAEQPENFKQSLNSPYGPTQTEATVALGSGSFSIDDAIAMHLVDCDQCRTAASHGRPVAIGQRSGLCGTYWQLQLMRAKVEGKVNNIVAHTEYGDEAPTGGTLG